ncbi:hypothetical protein SteCoe_24355 [Stentor coeruleus]|uniref:RING-type domain-containing protein n=1 Tax=Stentor coeruleus TaxID=5963 RepID=A0A1R2BHR3_9CILI|nr:hypothetical protein SteCoe_24355 [Stentor coeruleus]
MDQSLECPVCLNRLTSSLKPKILNCGHSLCTDCLLSISKKNPSLCPLCNTQIINPEALPYNFFILERITHLEIKCNTHRDTVADYLNRQSLDGKCSLCISQADHHNYIDLIDFDLADFLVQKAIDIEIENPAKIPTELRQKIRKLHNESNEVKIQRLKEVLKCLQVIKCQTHGKNGTHVNMTNGAIQCDQCKKTSNSISLESQNLSGQLNDRILDIASKVNSFNIPFHIREQLQVIISKNSEEKISILVKLLDIKNTNPGKVSISTCNSCSQEFSYPNNMPYRLPCEGIHVICEICANNSDKCPIDGRKFIKERLGKFEVKLPYCCNCEEICDNAKLPILSSCGLVHCKNCSKTKCICGCEHSVNTENIHSISKFYSQLYECLVIKCINDASPATHFFPSEMKGYCHRCAQGKRLEKIEEIDLEGILISECYRKSREIGNKLTPLLAKQLAELNSFTNLKKLEFFHILSNLNSPIAAPGAQKAIGLLIPEPQIKSFYIQRFNSVLPNPSIRSSIKPWFIDLKKDQIEVFCFQSFKTIYLTGVSISCPINNTEGVLDYLHVIKGDSFAGNLEAQCLSNIKLQGIVMDIMFKEPVLIEELQRFLIVFKIIADFVYKGNPLDKAELKGQDGTEFEVFEANAKGFFTNGQGNISGPLIRLFYRR